MLTKAEKYKCVECGRLFGTEGFAYYKGQIENGAAYFSDRGVLCSPECSLAHTRKRGAEGTPPERPARDPLGG